jgi:hypothetical protein
VGFAVLVTLLDGVATALVALRWKGAQVFQVDRKTWLLCALAGTMQMGAYWNVVWALAAPHGRCVRTARDERALRGTHFRLRVEGGAERSPAGVGGRGVCGDRCDPVQSSVTLARVRKWNRYSSSNQCDFANELTRLVSVRPRL